MSGNDMYNIPLSSDSESDPAATVGTTKQLQQLPTRHSYDQDHNPEEEEEKQRLIGQILELQNTLDDLSQKVDSVKEENMKLRSENQVLGQYIENLLAASTVFQPTSPRTKKKSAANKKK